MIGNFNMQVAKKCLVFHINLFFYYYICLGLWLETLKLSMSLAFVIKWSTTTRADILPILWVELAMTHKLYIVVHTAAIGILTHCTYCKTCLHMHLCYTISTCPPWIMMQLSIDAIYDVNCQLTMDVAQGGWCITASVHLCLFHRSATTYVDATGSLR